MDKQELKKIVDFIYESSEKVTFPVLLKEIEKMGIDTVGTKDYISTAMPNCIYWKNLSQEVIDILHDIDKYFQVSLQPFGYDNEGISLYQSEYPNIPIFNFFIVEKMTQKSKKKFVKEPYLMPVYWIKTSAAKIIRK